MPEVSMLTAFLAASLLLGVAPGPDNIFVLTQAALHGRRAGLLVTLGLASGSVVHTVAVAGGVAALFAASPAAFTALKTAGALYLGWLAVQAFRASMRPAEGSEAPPMRPGALYRRGIIMNLTNPKVSIFFLAFLPQFTDPLRGPVSLQIIALGLLFILSTLLVFGALALAAGAVGAWLARSEERMRWLQRGAGAVFASLALALLATDR